MQTKKIDVKEANFEEELVSLVMEDFLNRQEERRHLEQQWFINMNYLYGNQYCEISPSGEVTEEDKYYYWQNRNVYNHISPIIETRISKLARVRPVMSVRASGGEDRDLKTAKIATNIINSTSHRVCLDGVISKATLFSEVFGTGFYKILWNKNKGRVIGELAGEKVREGDVEIEAVSPFEIYPDSIHRDSLQSCKSLIHARAVDVGEIEEIYGVSVEPADINVFKSEKITTGSPYFQTKIISGVVHNTALVIERYEKPSSAFPNGRVITVAGGKLLAVSELPFVNGIDNLRDFPFVKQVCIAQPTSFFGISVIDRLIPLQRAYNAVKNRKHEFLNRLTMGVVTVEDGSIDADELVEEGLSPGKVIVYRQGSRPPQMMSVGSVPIDFTYEEERLTKEFITISGVSEISRNGVIPDNVTSGVALQVLLEQDETRLHSTAESIKRAIKEIAKHILRLFKQFAGALRFMKIAGETQKAEVFYFSSSDLTSDDVVFDTENELSTTPAQKKSAVLELLQTGLLSGENGKLDQPTKSKILEIMGFGSLENANDLTNLHSQRANGENVEINEKIPICEEYDDHEVHVTEHTRFLLSNTVEKIGEQAKQRLIEHLNQHKLMAVKQMGNKSLTNNDSVNSGN